MIPHIEFLVELWIVTMLYNWCLWGTIERHELELRNHAITNLVKLFNKLITFKIPTLIWKVISSHSPPSFSSQEQNLFRTCSSSSPSTSKTSSHLQIMIPTIWVSSSSHHEPYFLHSNKCKFSLFSHSPTTIQSTSLTPTTTTLCWCWCWCWSVWALKIVQAMWENPQKFQ